MALRIIINYKKFGNSSDKQIISMICHCAMAFPSKEVDMDLIFRALLESNVEITKARFVKILVIMSIFGLIKTTEERVSLTESGIILGKKIETDLQANKN